MGDIQAHQDGLVPLAKFRARVSRSFSTSTPVIICSYVSSGIREALFFLVTNVLVTFGMTAFDHTLSLICAFPSQFPELSPTPSISTAFAALKISLESRFVLGLRHNQRQVTNDRTQDSAFCRGIERLRGILDAVERIKGKSRSFWIASAAFEGRLKVDLILL